MKRFSRVKNPTLSVNFIFSQEIIKITIMKGLNKVTLIGNLGNNSEVLTLENQVKVAQFSLATSD